MTGVSQRRLGARVVRRLDGHGDRPDVLLVWKMKGKHGIASEWLRRLAESVW